MVRSFVAAVRSARPCEVRSDGALDSFSLLFKAFMLTIHIKTLMKVYMERKNMQLELIRFRLKCRIYSRYLCRTMKSTRLTHVFMLG